ncbi:hypothetical protein SmJEL517_g01181 [Synchytrium microbalum]|uniref:Amino acid transporter transmembrane domain-containing protein n=1 Tax=Synchytrium microbalum TaxID=1806994 RepID=A0A507C4Q2_9FUNG|nr:uncharacterized protein SmJEL517_g01181 [Synchytrium microbalum]TPX36520.1 hypothetical protein SmJEL517_g01181 [Synchytrium microbalum]
MAGRNVIPNNNHTNPDQTATTDQSSPGSSEDSFHSATETLPTPIPNTTNFKHLIATIHQSQPNDDSEAQETDALLDGHEVVEDQNVHIPTGSLGSSFLSVSNTILGTGMLAMASIYYFHPSAIASLGVGLGAIMITVSATFAAVGLTMLVSCAHKMGIPYRRTSSFFTIAQATYPAAAKWFDAAVAVKCFGVSVSYLFIVGDLMPKVVSGFAPTTPQDAFYATKLYWISIGVALIATPAFFRDLSSLRYTSMIALSSVAYLVVLVVTLAFKPLDGMPHRMKWEDIVWFKMDVKFFTALPILVFAFTCHQNILTVYNELLGNTPKRMSMVICSAVPMAFSIYQVIGITGYVTFGPDVKSNIIANYPTNSPFVTGGQLAIAILVLVSYPLQIHPARASLDRIIGRRVDPTSPIPALRFTVLTTVLVLSGYLLAVSVKSLGSILAFVGATGSTTICYILPGLLYHRLMLNMDPEKSVWARRAAFGMAGLGLVIMIACLAGQMVPHGGDVAPHFFTY